MKNKNEKEKKKILSNLNERDKKLLACVGGVAVLAGGGYLVTNSYTRMAQLAEEHATISTELEGKNAKISQRKSLTKQLQTLNAKTLDQAKKYYGTTNQGEFISIDNVDYENVLWEGSAEFNAEFIPATAMLIRRAN